MRLLYLLFVSLFSSAASAQFTLPIEVIGRIGVEKEISFNMSTPDKAVGVFLEINNHRYDGKGAISINDSRWIPLKASNVKFLDQSNEYGKFASANTVKLLLPVNQSLFKPQDNVVRFRFNRADGNTVGYRVINVNVLDSSGKRLIPRNAYRWVNTNTWKPMRDNPEDIKAGEALWYSAKLRNNFAERRALYSTCSSCHSSDGRDLKYFNYSDDSIIARSRFHGLSQQEGEQIASYVRSLPYSNPGQPWNPPYQPGKGTDAGGQERWAAGMGLQAVLRSDREMLPYLFPYGTSQDALKKVMNTQSTLNMRELPIPVQLPDWKSWLPKHAPEDIFESRFTESDYYKQYQYLASEAMNNNSVLRNDKEKLVSELDRFTIIGNKFRGQMVRTRGLSFGKGDNKDRVFDVPDWITPTMARKALSHWHAVKIWELNRAFGAETIPSELYRKGEKYAFPGKERNVFTAPPHINADNIKHYTAEELIAPAYIGNPLYNVFADGQELVAGKYESHVWYQLQVTLNSGHQEVAGNFAPVDWGYQNNHIEQLTKFSTVATPLHQFASMIKTYQARDNGLGPLNEATGKSVIAGWSLREVIPSRYIANPEGDDSSFVELDNYVPGLRASLTEGMLRQFIKVTKKFDLETWPRLPGGHKMSALDAKDYVPLKAGEGRGKMFPRADQHHADSFMRLFPYLIEMNIDPEVRNALLDWCKEAWPKGDWEEYRASQKEIAEWNQRPEVVLNPQSRAKQSYKRGERMTLNADAIDTDGQIKKVVFMRNGKPVHTVYNAPWKHTVSVWGGDQLFSAYAVDNKGVATMSNVIDASNVGSNPVRLTHQPAPNDEPVDTPPEEEKDTPVIDTPPREEPEDETPPVPDTPEQPEACITERYSNLSLAKTHFGWRCDTSFDAAKGHVCQKAESGLYACSTHGGTQEPTPDGKQPEKEAACVTERYPNLSLAKIHFGMQCDTKFNKAEGHYCEKTASGRYKCSTN